MLLVRSCCSCNERYWREYNREHRAKIAKKPPKPGQEKVWAKLQAKKAELGLVE